MRQNDSVVAICSLIRDPYPPYLMEWLQHHLSIGVDLFFIYDNESSPSIREIVKESSFENNTIIFDTPGRVVQMQSYDKCINDIKSGALPLCNWLAVIDEDEFIICENKNIKETMTEYEDYPGLVVSWRVYGSSGLKFRTPVPQMRKFIHPTSPNNPVNRHVKSIVNPLKVKRPRRNPHTFVYLGCDAVDVNHVPFMYRHLFRAPIYKKIWINHYYIRSEEEWNVKVKRPNPDSLRAYLDPVTKKEVHGVYRNQNALMEIDADCEKYQRMISHEN